MLTVSQGSKLPILSVKIMPYLETSETDPSPYDMDATSGEFRDITGLEAPDTIKSVQTEWVGRVRAVSFIPSKNP